MRYADDEAGISVEGRSVVILVLELGPGLMRRRWNRMEKRLHARSEIVRTEC
jgi:hypothetical protein